MCEEERRASREEEEEKVVKVIGSALLSVRLANLLGLPLAKQPPVNLKAVGREGHSPHPTRSTAWVLFLGGQTHSGGITDLV